MKKFLFFLTAAAVCTASAVALPKAFYVKQGEKVTKYNFGVAENLVFSDNGHTLSVRGYGESINLDEIDYISFSAPLTEAMTPSAQKERLVQIGQEAYDAIDLNDQTDMLRMWHDFFESDYDYNTYEYTYMAPVEYYLPQEYYDVHAQAKSMAHAMQELAKGNPAAARVLKAAVVNLYKIEDYYGIYTADKASETWKKTDSDHFEIRFSGRDGSEYSVTLVAGKEFTTWTSKDFDGQFPRHIDISLAKGTTVLATTTLDTELADRQRIDMTLDFKAGDYLVNNVLHVVDTDMSDKVKVTVKGKEYVNADAHVVGKNFVNYEYIFDAVKAANGYYDENDDWVDGDGSDLCAMFRRAEGTVDLLGKLQVRGILHNGSQIYSTLSLNAAPYHTYVKDGVRYYSDGKIVSRNGSTIHVSEYDIEVLGKQMNLLNDHSDAGFYYDGEEKLQGYIGWDYTEDTWERYMDYEYGNPYYNLDGYLLNVYREDIYNETTGEYVHGPWKYQGYKYDENGDYVETVYVEVSEDSLIYPETMVYHNYELSPTLWFPDGTSFAFGDFFDEGSFSKLIDDYNDIINTYLTITGQN